MADVTMRMPKGSFAERRRRRFEDLANSLFLTSLELRVLLSNVFVWMARQGRPRG